jgi:DNA-directed RNA polymerase specialized sigma24 family protein
VEKYLYAELRRLAERGAICAGVPEHAVPDIAQEVSDRFVRRLRAGSSVPEAPDGYVWRMAENRGRDWHRARAREAKGQSRLEREELEPAQEWPETIWLERESRAELVERVRSLVERAPENYRRVLTRHYLDDEPIETVVTEYLEEEQGANPDARLDAEALEAARRRVRQRVDAHLSRARRWLRSQLAQHPGGESS